MKKVKIILLALSALGMVGCGGGASKDDACGCLESGEDDLDFKGACEESWDACDEAGGKDGKDCKDGLQDLFCP